MEQPQGVPEQSQDSGSPCPNQSCCLHVEVESVLALTCVAWVCAAAAAEQRLPKIQQECWYSSCLSALEIPFLLFCLPWTGWLIPGNASGWWCEQGRWDTSEHMLPAFPWLRALTRGCLHRDTPNQAVNVVPPLCFTGWAQSPSGTGLGPFGSTSPPCAHRNVVTINLVFHFLLDQN